MCSPHIVEPKDERQIRGKERNFLSHEIFSDCSVWVSLQPRVVTTLGGCRRAECGRPRELCWLRTADRRRPVLCTQGGAAAAVRRSSSEGRVAGSSTAARRRVVELNPVRPSHCSQTELQGQRSYLHPDGQTEHQLLENIHLRELAKI